MIVIFFNQMNYALVCHLLKKVVSIAMTKESSVEKKILVKVRDRKLNLIVNNSLSSF